MINKAIELLSSQILSVEEEEADMAKAWATPFPTRKTNDMKHALFVEKDCQIEYPQLQRDMKPRRNPKEQRENHFLAD